MIGAYYYSWYNKSWLNKTVRISDPPKLGEYTNTIDNEIVHSHFDMAEKAGIDFFSLSWSPNTSYEHIVKIAKNKKTKITFFYESLFRSNHVIGNILFDIKSIKDIIEEDCWLKIDNKPVLMLYVSRRYEDLSIFDKIREVLGDIFLVGDDIFWNIPNLSRAKKLDAITYYNLYEMGKFKVGSEEDTAKSFNDNIKQTISMYSNSCIRNNIELWPNVMPGYNDSGIRPEKNNVPISRRNGETFLDSINYVKTLPHRVMMITSFNEWYEDTQIEPSEAYGDKYLSIIRSNKKIDLG